MKKFFKSFSHWFHILAKPIYEWVPMAAIVLVLSVIAAVIGLLLVTVNNGAGLSAVSHLTTERVITEDVSTFQRDGDDFIRYKGSEYLLPANKVIYVGEIFQNFDNGNRRNISKTIVFDEKEQEFLYKEHSTTYSRGIERTKRRLEIVSCICCLFGLPFLLVAIIGVLAVIFFLVCCVGDMVKAVKDEKVRRRAEEGQPRSDWTRRIKKAGQFTGRFFCINR